MKRYNFLGLAAMALLAASCGVVGTKQSTNVKVELPTQAEADSIANVHAPAAAAASSTPSLACPVQKAQGPRVYVFSPSVDSNYIKVTSLMPKSGKWVEESSVNYVAFDMVDGLRFKAFDDSAVVMTFGGQRFFTFGALRENGTAAASTEVLYNLDTDGIQSVTFSGKYLKDGRIEGSSNKTMLVGTERAEMQWAIARQAENPKFVELSRGNLMSDQAIEWWLEYNPKALTSASKVVFGALPAESSLVEAFKSAKKENSPKYRAALIRMRGYAVVVAYRKSSAAYYIAWVEPLGRKGASLNNIYFENDTNLALYYYRGNTTFKHHVNLASAKITR